MGTVLLVAALALVVVVANSPPSFVYDERAYVKYVPLLREHGLSETFLDALPGGAGPLYAFLHHALGPLTTLSPVGMRLVNVALLAVVVGILAAWLRRQERADYLLASGAILVVPMTWVLAGMALTSMPALVLVSLSLYLLLRGVEAVGQEARVVVGWFAAAGIVLGVAVWGRQPTLVLAGVPLLLALLDRRLRLPAGVFVGIVAVFLLPLVAAWEGFTPPNEEAEEGLSLRYGVTSLGYAGICFFLLAPRWKWFAWKSLVVGAAVAAGANAAFGFVAPCPFAALMESFVEAPAVAGCAVLFGALLVFCAVMFLGWILKFTLESRGDLKQVTIYAGLLCITLSPALIENYYSSRYTAMALPYLVLAAQPWRKWNWKMYGAAIGGCGAGLASLLGYFWAA